MKTILYTSLFAFIFAACNTTPANIEDNKPAPVANLGKAIKSEKTTSVDDIIKQLNDTTTVFVDLVIDGGNAIAGIPATIEGQAVEVCQTAGCWFSFKNSDGKELTILVKDKQFKVPADATGKTIVAQGGAYKSITTVEELRQIAKSNGVPAEKIAEINSPAVEYFFTTDGIAIK
jgi:hypothetical protein